MRVLSLRTRFLLFAFLLLGAIATMGWYTQATLQKFQHDGPIYGPVVRGKDLIADVLPPPEYIIEAYLTVREASLETNAEEIARLERLGRDLSAQYYSRHAHWVRELEDDAIKNAVVVEAYEPARKFFELRDRDFFPALHAGKPDTARQLALGPLRDLYRAHREVIDRIVVMQRARNGEHQAAVDALVHNGPIKLLVAFVGAMLVVLVGFWGLSRSVLPPIRNLALAARRFTNDGHDGAALRSRDEFSELAASLGHAYDLAMIDSLTGLSSRKAIMRYLIEDIALARRRELELSIILIDLDHFKEVNDVHGHHAGDDVLRQVACRLASTVRTEDAVGRFGGEEFLVIARGSGPVAATTLGQRLRDSITSAPIATVKGELSITFSAGVACLADCGSDSRPEVLIDIADRRLYAAKRAGRNWVIGDDGATSLRA